MAVTLPSSFQGVSTGQAGTAACFMEIAPWST